MNPGDALGTPSPAGVFRSGFVSVVGRPNVGKSTLVNRICGQKVSIVSDKPQTTRLRVRGILTRPDAQLVFVDTPGLHKPLTALGARANAEAVSAIGDVDVVCLVVDATQPFGKGDRWVADRVPPGSVLVLNKCDTAGRNRIAEQLAATASLDCEAWFPVSARTGEGVAALVEHLVARMPEGPAYYPDETVRDSGEEFFVAELVREQLLAVAREELPYSIATRVRDWERTPRGDRITVEILVERESQKGIVIGKGGGVLKAVGTAVRAQLPPGTHIELVVRVDRNWQHRADRVERLLGAFEAD